MSKLVDKLHQTSRASSKPMGFRGAGSPSARKSPPMVLVAQLREDGQSLAAGEKGGAHAVLLTKTDREVIGALADVPWGISLDEAGDEGFSELKALGCDFVLFEPDAAPPTVLSDGQLGKIVKLEPSLPDGLMRALGTLPVDAVLLGGDDRLSVQRLMVCRHVASLVRKPLIITMPLDTPKEALRELQEAGIAGVMVVADGRDTEGLARLRQAIDALPPTRSRKQKLEPTLPYPRPEPEFEEEDDFI